MPLIDDISRFSGRASSERRRELLRSVTDLFLGHEAYSESTLKTFEDVLLTVADFAATEARAEFADRMADRDDAPPKLVDHLVNDHPSVAIPMLKRSPALSDATLASLAARGSQDHLMAIAGRRIVSEIVSDLLVSRGDQRVVRHIAGNLGARFSRAGFDGLTKMAGGDKELQARLVTRGDLPAESVESLLPILSDALTLRLAEAGYGDDGRLPAHVMHKLQEKLGARAEDTDRAARRLERLIEAVRGGKLALPGLVEELATQDKPEDLAKVLAAFAGVTDDVCAGALSKTACDEIVVIARAVDLTWACFLTVVTLRARRFQTTDTSDPSLKKRYINIAQRDAQRALAARFGQAAA